MVNYYERLGLSFEASDEEIKSALVENLCDVPYDELQTISKVLTNSDLKAKYDKELIAFLETDKDHGKESVAESDKAFFFKFVDKFKQDDLDNTDLETLLDREDRRQYRESLLANVDVHKNDKYVSAYAILYLLFVICSLFSVLLDQSVSHNIFGFFFFIISLSYFVSLFILTKKEISFLNEIKVSPLYLVSCFFFIPLIYFLKRTSLTETLKWTVIVSALGLALEFIFFI